MPTATKPRRNRFSSDPVRRNGRSAAIAPEFLHRYPLHRDILKRLAQRRILSADYLALLCGSTYRYTSDVCAILASKPYQYIKCIDPQIEQPNQYLYTKNQFELTKDGEDAVLKHFGIVVPERDRIKNYVHDIMVDQVSAAFEIGAMQSNGRIAFMSQAEIVAHPNTPEMTRLSPRPQYLPLNEDIENEDGSIVKHVIRPDGELFAIRNVEEKKVFFFPGIEVGRGKETRRPTSTVHNHSFMNVKLADYIAYQKRALFRTLFNVRNSYHLFVEPTPGMLTAKLIPTFRDMTKDCPEVRPFFVFKTHPEFTVEHWASGHMLTTPFLVVREDGTTTEFSMV